MFEKTDVRYANGRPGSGGEYEVQAGFGWANGVVLDFLEKWVAKELLRINKN